MIALVTFKFDDGPLINEGAIVSTTFSPLQINGKSFSAQGQINLKKIVRSVPKSN